MIKRELRFQPLRVVFFGAALFACGAGAGATPTDGAEKAVLFDMSALIDVDPYDIPALEERFASGRIGTEAAGSGESDVSAPAAGYALARALSLAGEPEKALKALIRTESLLKKTRGADPARSILAAHVYLELIVDGPTWKRFNPDLEAAAKGMEKAGASRTDMAYVEAKRLAIFPPEIGGDIGRSLELFASIGEESALFELGARYARALIAADERERARAVLEKRMAANPRDAAAAAILDRLRVEWSGATVRAVILPEGLRTARDRIATAIRLGPGERISSEAVKNDLARLSELSGIASADVRYRYDGAANAADVEYFVSEEKSRSFSLFMSGTLHAGPHASGYLYTDEGEFTGALIYGDSNLFGRAWNLNLISAGVYNKIELAKAEIGGTAFDIGFEAEGLFLSAEELYFYDEHRYLEEERALTGKYLRFGATVGFPMPLGARFSASYCLRKDWYIREEETSGSFTLPDDLLHTARMGLELDMRGRSGPAGIIPVGPRFGAEIEYDYYQGFREWGSADFWNTAPENGLGTIKYGAEAAYGAIFLERFNAGVSLGAYGGKNYYTRTCHRLGGSAGPVSSSLRFLRGYRDDEFTAETAVVGHLDAGYELSPGKLHVGLFSDTAALRPVLADVDSWRTVHSAGIGVAAVLPWDIQVYAEYGHGFTDLSGSIDHGHDTLSFILIRSFSW